MGCVSQAKVKTVVQAFVSLVKHRIRLAWCGSEHRALLEVAMRPLSSPRTRATSLSISATHV